MATVHLHTVCAMSMNAKHETRPLQNVTRGPLFVKASLPINLMQQLGHMQYVAAQLHLMYRSIQEHKHHIPTNLSQPSTTAHLEHSTGINKYNLIVKVRFGKHAYSCIVTSHWLRLSSAMSLTAKKAFLNQGIILGTKCDYSTWAPLKQKSINPSKVTIASMCKSSELIWQATQCVRSPWNKTQAITCKRRAQSKMAMNSNVSHF